MLPINTAVHVVDVSAKPAQAKIVREGFQVPPVTPDVQKANFFFNQLIPIPTVQLPRVISQSVTAGTKVVKGAVVDLVLAPREIIPFDMFSNLHADLVGKAVPILDPVLNQPNVRQILLSNEDPAGVNAADKTTLTTALKTAGVNVNEADPARTFTHAFNSARGALAFR
jgi:hypothetical protein